MVEVVGFGDRADESYTGEVLKTTSQAVYVRVRGLGQQAFRKADGYRVGDRHRDSGYRLATTMNGSIGVAALERPAGEKTLVFMVGVYVQGDETTKLVFVGESQRFVISNKNGLWWLPVDERPTGAACARGHATVKSLLKAWAEHVGLS